MQYFVKSNGPVILTRGPFDTEQQAKDCIAGTALSMGMDIGSSSWRYCKMDSP
jgi:hypothetical protein